MNSDFTTSLVNFYKSYKNDYESFYKEEIEPACKVIASGNNASGLQRKIQKIRDNLHNLDFDWSDSADSQFRSYLTSCEEYLKVIEDSINSQFIGIAENAYQNLKNLIETLDNQNESYNEEFNNKPNRNDFQISAQYKNGVKVKDGYFDSDSYNEAVGNWKESVNTKANACIDTINSIEEEKERLSEVDSSVIKLENTSVPLVENVPEFEFEGVLGLKGSVQEYIVSNGLPFVRVNLWGRDYYMLANISGVSLQGNDKCLAYANAYAEGITEHNGYKASSPYLYSSADPNEILQIVASEYTNGRSVVLEVNGKNNGSYRHFVAVAGLAADADLSNIQSTDVLIIDPTGGDTKGFKQLGTTNGGQERYLKSAREMKSSTNTFNTDYAINVFSDVNYAELLPNTTLSTHGGATQNGASSKSAIKFQEV